MAHTTITTPHGKCRLHWDVSYTLAECLADGSALLCIRPDSGAWSEFWVSENRADDRLLGYRLNKHVARGDEPTVYDVDLTFGGWDFASCDCPDYTYKRGPKTPPCKHVAALRAALMHYGAVTDKTAAVAV